MHLHRLNLSESDLRVYRRSISPETIDILSTIAISGLIILTVLVILSIMIKGVRRVSTGPIMLAVIMATLPIIPIFGNTVLSDVASALTPPAIDAGYYTGEAEVVSVKAARDEPTAALPEGEPITKVTLNFEDNSSLSRITHEQLDLRTGDTVVIETKEKVIRADDPLKMEVGRDILTTQFEDGVVTIKVNGEEVKYERKR